jgi:hypothetical protein
MTSNLPVVGVELAQSGHLASAALERGLTVPQRVSGGASAYAAGPSSALAGVDSEFARVLLEVMTADAHARMPSTPRPAVSAAAGAAGESASLARALLDARLEWVAAPLIHRAIDAYRELMNVAG